MAIRYIISKTARLYTNSSGSAYEQILIYGEELYTSGKTIDGRIKATYRNKYIGYVATKQIDKKASLELYFIDVGQGDAALIVTPNRKKILVDGGYNKQAKGFLQWKYQLADLTTPKLEIDLLVLSHADQDHLKGLIDILEHDRIVIKKIIHNGIGMFKNMDQKSGDLSADRKYLITHHSSVLDLGTMELRNIFSKWIKLVEKLNIPYEAVSSKTGIIEIGDPDITMEIIAPVVEKSILGEKQFKWLKNHSHTINGHSVVFSITYNNVKTLFSGDINIEGSDYLLEHPNTQHQLRAHILKTPHHGSHEFHPSFFEAIRPQISVVSSGDSPDHGHPRANFIGAVGLASRSKSPLIFSTEIASTFSDASEVDLKTIVPNHSLNKEDIKGARLFKKKLNGMINVRTDGKNLYAMRRVTAGYWWESYGPILAEDFPSIF
ncbi:MBL fold metallo-hydrolase [Cellulophaga sp. HaHaR_3_176]|uniref:ComEC/Rec2 family competence protein n=1 Tax=Cellulophaga sp. HaHaR_3_176 TaxID=1942464 RepID=UPI001C1F943F|nr:MBL fold metallo-hydrolase [Cellulophaga sp. HaHaR_3_176]QWX83913.1 MBL fold metallo-hydrolase [Cellulophaga sp. HaHaR_3_176]